MYNDTIEFLNTCTPPPPMSKLWINTQCMCQSSCNNVALTNFLFGGGGGGVRIKKNQRGLYIIYTCFPKFTT